MMTEHGNPPGEHDERARDAGAASRLPNSAPEGDGPPPCPAEESRDEREAESGDAQRVIGNVRDGNRTGMSFAEWVELS